MTIGTPRTDFRPLPVVGHLAAVLAVAGASALMLAPAATANPGVIVVVERASTDTVTDIGQKGDSIGDVLTFSNEAFDASNTNKLGTAQGVCIRTVPGVAWDCGWTLMLSDGQLMVQGPFYDNADSVLAIIGGTGQYADARGEMDLTHITPDDSAHRFTYRVM